MEVFGTREIWSELKNTKKPILLYGMGNGADKIIAELENIGVSANGFFASDGFVRGQKFHEKTVMSYAQACEKYGDFTVLVAFGSSLSHVIENIKKIAAEKTTYAPDVPVAGEEIFNAEFYFRHIDKIDAARELLADDMSREAYDRIIKYKLDGNISHFYIDTPKRLALESLLSGEYSAYIDLGAYNGDTISEALEYFPSINKITALEPSPRIFKKLAENVKTINSDVKIFNMAASSSRGEATLIDGAGRNSQIKGESAIQAHGARAARVETVAADDICKYKNEKLLIKLDVEGDEAAALDGARRILSENDCELIVSAYHRSRDIFDLPIKIRSVLPNHKIYLRKHPYIPAWDVNLYVKA